MVHHIILFKLKPEVTPETLEELMRKTRISLLKIPEALNVKCGKRIDPLNDWPFFIAVDFDSMDRMEAYHDDPIHVKFAEEVLKPVVLDRVTLDYEMEPGKDVKFS
jgi:hypothetical protein